MQLPLLIVMMLGMSVSYAGYSLSEDEMREATEMQSLSNVDELYQTEAENFQRDVEQSKNAPTVTAIVPPQLDMRQQDLLRGSLTPDQIREENMNESYRDGTIVAPWAYF